MDAHPMTDEQAELEELEYHHTRLLQMFQHSGFSNVPEYGMTLDVSYMASSTRNAANDLRLLAEGVVAGLDRIQMLLEDDSVDGL